MNQAPRYQIFISSTYDDLREERQQATQAILEAGHFPAGMELFPASDSNQWELIKRVIEESDYYVLIIGGRYGSIGPNGQSYTEMEYDYAVKISTPVLGFVRGNIDDISSGKTEQTEEGRNQLASFRKKVLSRTCRKYSTPLDLGMSVLKSLMSEIRINPRNGWIRADQARSDDDLKRERNLIKSLEDAEEHIITLERELRDRCISIDEVPRDKLSSGSDLFNFKVTFKDNSQKFINEDVGVSWDEIFLAIGPTIYGFIVRKGRLSNGGSGYTFEENIQNIIREKVIERAQGRAIKIQNGQIDRCVIHLKELGLLMFSEKQENDGDFFRGVTLTEYGERYLTMKNVVTRE